jgi:hypothetical protein
MREKQMKQRLRVLLSLSLLVSLFASIPMLFAQEDDPEDFQGYFFSAEPPQGWFGENWYITEEPGGELAVFTPAEVDFGDFDPSEGDLNELIENINLITALRDGGILGTILYNGNMLADEGMEAGQFLAQLTSLAGITDFTEGTVEGRGVTGTSIQGTIPGSGELSGITFGFYGALMTNDTATVILIAAAPEAVFEELLPQFEHYAQTMETNSDTEPTTFETETEGFVGVESFSYSLEIPADWSSSFHMIAEDDGYQVSILSSADIELSDEAIAGILGDLTADEEFVTALSDEIVIGIVEVPRETIGDCPVLADCASLVAAGFEEAVGDALVESSELQPVTIGGAEGVEMIATLSAFDATFGMRALLVENQGSAFLIVAGGPQEQFMAQQDTIQQILDSLTFK